MAPCPVTLLSCNENHFFHTECIDGWVEHNKNARKTPSCPLCRARINESAMKKLEFKGIEGPPSIPEAEMTEVQRAAH